MSIFQIIQFISIILIVIIGKVNTLHEYFAVICFVYQSVSLQLMNATTIFFLGTRQSIKTLKYFDKTIAGKISEIENKRVGNGEGRVVDVVIFALFHHFSIEIMRLTFFRRQLSVKTVCVIGHRCGICRAQSYQKNVKMWHFRVMDDE